MNSNISISAAAIALGLAWAPPAQADLSACGNIHVEAEGMCEVKIGIECQAECTPVNLQAACAARLHASCEPTCTELPSVECTGECSGSCEASCSEFEPGEFDCQGECQGSCSADCSGRCEASDDQAQCEASCVASCDGSCQGSCEGVPPSADCSASCEGSCEGSCDVDANFDCEGGCQAEGFADCEVELEGGCTASCEREEGAVFCDGSYVDDGGNLEACLNALAATLNIMVSGSAMSSCDDGSCEASAEGTVSIGGGDGGCTVGYPARGGSPMGLLFIGLAALVLRRRR